MVTVLASGPAAPGEYFKVPRRVLETLVASMRGQSATHARLNRLRYGALRPHARYGAYAFMYVTIFMFKAVIGWPATDCYTLSRNFIASGGKP